MAKKKLTGDDIQLTFLAIPTFIWYIIFSYLPMFGLIIAFKDFKIAGKGFLSNLIKSDWVGFKNFEFLFATKDAYIIIRNTLVYNIIFIILGIVIPVTLAIMLNQLNNKRLAKFYQTSMFLPHFLSWVVVSYFVFSFLSSDKGLVNQILASRGKEPVQWYMEKKYWPFILIFMNSWKTMGYNMIVYLAAITGMDESYYEAALMDGASKWQQIKYITLPLLKPIVVIMFILAVGRIFNADFGLFYQVPKNSGALFDVTNVLDTYVYRALSGTGSIGMSSAAAFFQSVVGCLMIIASNMIIRKVDKESALF
jgi:putative aldouronate transport system permease protein